MSSFLVSDECVSKCVTAMLPAASQDERTDLGRKLIAMNQKALKARYDDKPEPITYVYSAPMASKVALLKALRCLAYQCAEGNVPRMRLYKDVEKHAGWLAIEIVGETPEYDRAMWG